MKLYTYWRSSAAYRVRIALNLKNVTCDFEYIHLVKDGGEHKKSSYTSKNPQGLVPTLELDDGQILRQSLAIIDYIDQNFGPSQFLSEDPLTRAHIQAVAQIIACDIHPVNNLRILQYLSHEFNVEDDEKAQWYTHWVHQGFDAIEAMLAQKSNGKFCFGNQTSLADICLIPQVYNAKRFHMDMDRYPVISSINDHCMTLNAFYKASPEVQKDAI
ncbi:maleylacetoacetate isomerase [Curvivirga aplysinae]|uniref:maleylacetoacetate isomerase n=1 Tax=Curvivirga aplysinae TaxID=2529852 RepID=UPI0012BBEA4A|nr:maleylacetoacetate isomerase [Curvivirga aplysinae]MTI08998.1 maleylacetoacetate isomerase [Curvivirga aplysinae]